MGIHLTNDEAVTTETIRVENADLTLTLTKEPFDVHGVLLQTISGNDIPREQYIVQEDGSVEFQDRVFGGIWIRAIYQHWEFVSTWQKTLAEAETLIEAVSDPGGNAFFTVTIVGDSSRLAERLTRRHTEDIPVAGVSSDWSLVIVRELGDSEFQDQILNDDGTAFGSELERWAKQAKLNTRILWGLTVLDVDIWDAEAQTRPSGFLPHLWDSKVTEWFAQGSTERYNANQRLSFGGFTRGGSQELIRDGFIQSQFHSGIGSGTDLQVDVIEVVE